MEYVHYLDCGSGYMGVYLSQNLLNFIFKYVQFIICQLYLKKAVFKMYIMQRFGKN